jgi:hypothetical protein
VKEIRICFIGLNKLVTKDNSLMFYWISVNLGILVKYVSVYRNLNG